MKNLITCLIVCVMSGATFADTWTVDDDGKADFDNIQAAIDAALDGDTIEVQAGIYYETINYLSKSITVTGVEGSAVTIIDAQLSGTAVTISETLASTVLAGFTIKKGVATAGGGLLLSNCADLQITDCDIRANIANAGGGLKATDSTVKFQDSFIRNNQTNGGGNIGGGLYLNGCTVDMVNTTISGNASADDGAGAWMSTTTLSMQGGGVIGNSSQQKGGGLYLISDSDASLFDTELSDNYAFYLGGAIYCANNNRIDLLGCFGSNNTTQCANSPSYGGGTIYLGDSAICTVHNCDFRDGCSYRGGWMYVSSSCVVDIFNTILGGFSAFQNVANGHVLYIANSSAVVFIASSVICVSDPISGGWIDKGGNSFPAECPEYIDTGSCCLNGVCLTLTLDECSTFFGIFLGVETSCDDLQCPALSDPTGACCLDMGQCVTTTEVDCLIASGAYAGTDMLCNDIECLANCPEDVTGDGVVNVSDLLAIIAVWGTCP